MVRIKSKKDLLKILPIKVIDNQSFDEFQKKISKKISYQFSHFFNSYTQSFNKKYNRMGGLLAGNFERKHVDREKYFLKVIHYIHSNPVEHGFTEKIPDWKFSSYHAIINNSAIMLCRQEVINCFGDVENFIYVHQKPFEK